LFKQEVANYLINTRRRREEFRNLPIGAKLEQLEVYGAKTNPQILKKEFIRHAILNKYQEAINNSNLSEDAKLFLLAHAPYFAELTVKNPAYFNAFLNIIAKHSKKQDEAKQEHRTGSWRLSLDEEKRRGFGIKLEEPQLVIPQISPPQMFETKQQSTQSKSQQSTQSKSQQSKTEQSDIISTFWLDGVKWGVRKKKDGGLEYVLLGEAPLVEQDIDPLAVSIGGVAGKLLSKIPIPPKVGGGFGKMLGRGSGTKVAEKEAQQVAENVAKETAQNVASQQAKAQNVAGKTSKYEELRKRTEKLEQNLQELIDKIRDARRRLLEEKIKEEMDRTKINWRFARPPSQIDPEEVRQIIKMKREKKLPVLAQKETRWEFAERKLPVKAKQETAITFKPKETPYKEDVAQQGLKTSQILEEFLKKTQPKVETKETVLKPIKKLENLVKEIPEETKNNPEVRRRLVEITRDLKKISREAPFRDISDDLKVLDAKVDELKALLKKKYSGTQIATEKATQPSKKKKSNK